MATSGMLPGSAVPAPQLFRFAKTELENPPEDFHGADIFPEVPVTTFEGTAPIRWDDSLDAYADDVAGLKTEFPEVEIVESDYSWSLGMHARMAKIGVNEKIKAEQARAASGGGSDPLFDLEGRLTRAITGQNARHCELLRMMALDDDATYDSVPNNLFDSIEIDTITADAFVATILRATRQVSRAGKGPANYILIGDGVSEQMIISANLRSLGIPWRAADATTAPRILTPEDLAPLLRLAPGVGKVRVATQSYRMIAKADALPMLNMTIWVGRVATPNGDGDGFGVTRWHPCLQNKQRVYVNRIVAGHAETVSIGIQNFYQAAINEPALGVKIPVTISG